MTAPTPPAARALSHSERMAAKGYTTRDATRIAELEAALETLLDRLTDGRSEMSRGEMEENADLIRITLAKAKP